MIAPGDHQLRVRQGVGNNFERFSHELKPFVGSPFPECEDAMLRIAAPGKIRVFGPARQNPMGPDVNIVVTVLVMKDLPISGHEHGDRIREQEHSGGNRPGSPVGSRITNPRILQIDGIHQVVQSDVGIAAAQTRQQRGKESQEGVERIPAKRTEEQIEPHHIGFQFPDCLD
jgi:hypothetical protein